MLQFKDYTLTSFLEGSTEAYSNLTALQTWRVKGSEVSYPVLLARSRSIAHFLANDGVKKGDAVAILGESCPNWTTAYFGINCAGAVAVPILPDFSEFDVQRIMNHSQAKVVFVNSKHASKVKGLGVKVIRMEDLFYIPDFESSDLKAVKFKDLGGIDTKATALSSDDMKVLEQRRPQEDDVASLIYTSGTTGTPKAVMLTNRNICWNAYVNSTTFIKITPGWDALSILPLSHVYEFTIGMLLLLISGVQIHYLGKAPSPASLMPALSEVRPHVVLSVPLLIEKVYRRALAPKIKEDTTLGKLYRNRLTAPFIKMILHSKVMKTFGGRVKFFGVGGAAFDPEAEAFFNEIRFPYAVGYGLTETSPLIAGFGPKAHSVGTVGFPIDGLSVKIDPENSEVLVKGPSVMKGYYRNDELNEEVFTKDGYFRTGDIGALTEEGRLVIKGRCKTMILGPSGENIYPESIEFLLDAEENVVESLVVADQTGRLTAMVHLDLETLKKKGIVAMENVEEYLEKILESVNSKLSAFSKIKNIKLQKVPFERTPSNKIKRFLYQQKVASTKA